MNKKLILLFLIFIFLFSFFLLQRNKDKVNNDSQKSLVQEENKEEKKENLNNYSQENEESIKISNYFSILIIIFFGVIIFNGYIEYIINRSNWQQSFYDFSNSFFKNLFKIIKIEFFLPLGIISYIHGFEELRLKYQENNINEIKYFLKDDLKMNLFYSISSFIFTIFIFLFYLSLISLPFLIGENGLKNFKKRFRWRYLFISPFLFFRQGNILMKIMIILILIFIIYFSVIFSFVRKFFLKVLYLIL